MSDAVESAEEVEVGPTDVLFACPYCEKSMVIDRQAAGLNVKCPDCGEEVQVPHEDRVDEGSRGVQLTPDQRIESLSNALQIAHGDIRRLSASLEEVTNRRKVLEKFRARNIRRQDRVAEELTVIQSAVDRIASILQDAEDVDGPSS
jgi:predicted RNA-binding Zn-ribbon protein involved in translation (DUF1610 family)